jgi:phenol/toluene 2-monooxygenase (NADH) P4/A4
VSLATLGAYTFPAKDVRSNFQHPLLYVGWDEHMMFCAPLAVPFDLNTRFGDIATMLLPALYGEHPDFARINWAKAQWFRGSTWFTPDLERWPNKVFTTSRCCAFARQVSKAFAGPAADFRRQHSISVPTFRPSEARFFDTAG